MAGFSVKHKWPYFKYTDKHYICTYQIDNQQPLPLSAHSMVTYAHFANGNLGRYWQTIGKATPNDQAGEWILYIGSHVITLSVDYIDITENTTLDIDYKKIEKETSKTGFSENIKQRLESLQNLVSNR